MVYEEIVISVLGVVGTGSIITACLTYVLDKRKKMLFRVQKYKEMRYKAIILHMKTLLKPSDLKYMQMRRPDLRNMEDVKNEVETELFNCLLFASDDVITSLKRVHSQAQQYNLCQNRVRHEERLLELENGFDIRSN